MNGLNDNFVAAQLRPIYVNTYIDNTGNKAIWNNKLHILRHICRVVKNKK